LQKISVFRKIKKIYICVKGIRPGPNFERKIRSNRKRLHLESHGKDTADDGVGEAGPDVRHHPVKVGRVAHARIQQRGNAALRVSIYGTTNDQMTWRAYILVAHARIQQRGNASVRISPQRTVNHCRARGARLCLTAPQCDSPYQYQYRNRNNSNRLVEVGG